MKCFTVGVALLFCLSSAHLANATAIYDFSLPENGSVSAFDIQLVFPDLLQPQGLLVIPVTSPEVASLTFNTPGFTPGGSVIGLEITPSATLFGVALFNAAAEPLLFTVAYPADFFLFNRTPGTIGTFSSVAGNVASALPLATGTPVGTLSVTTSVPEPSTLILLASGVFGVSVFRRRAKEIRDHRSRDPATSMVVHPATHQTCQCLYRHRSSSCVAGNVSESLTGLCDKPARRR